MGNGDQFAALFRFAEEYLALTTFGTNCEVVLMSNLSSFCLACVREHGSPGTAEKWRNLELTNLFDHLNRFRELMVVVTSRASKLGGKWKYIRRTHGAKTTTITEIRTASCICIDM